MSSTMSGMATYHAQSAAADVHYNNATIINQQSAANLRIAGKGMTDLAAEGNKAQSQARASQGATGLTTEGTGSSRESRIAMQLADKMGVASSNAAQADANARHAAEMERWSGSNAKEAGKAAIWSGVTADVLNAGLSLFSLPPIGNALVGAAGGATGEDAETEESKGIDAIGFNKQTFGAIFTGLFPVKKKKKS